MAASSQRPFDLVDDQVQSRLSGLGLSARVPMLGSVSGRHRSPVRGSSLEFAEYRKYVPGDDTRRVDWRAWGRSDRIYIKEYEADTNLRLCLVVDTSGSLSFEAGGVSKLDRACQIAGNLAYLASRQGDAVGLYCNGGGDGGRFHSRIPPKRSARHLRAVLDGLGVLEAKGETGLAAALHEAAETIKQRALVVILSDLFLEPEVLQDCFQHLRFRKHDVAAFHLLDQSEVDFAFERPTRFLDLEGGAPIMTDPVMIGSQYRKAMRGYLEELEGVVHDASVDYHRVGLDDPVDEVLARFLIGRRPRKRGGGPG